MTCKLKRSTARSARSARVRLSRAGKIYASGTMSRLVARRTVKAGRYTLTITKRDHVQRIAVQVR